MENVVFWFVMPCGFCKKGCFGGTYRLHHQGDKVRRDRNNVHSVLRSSVTVKFGPSSLILVTLMVAIRSSETLVLTRSTRRIQKTSFLIVTSVKTSSLTLNLKVVLTKVYDTQNHWDYGLCPSSVILNNYKNTLWKLDLFPSSS
jgi:hypothetical protein